jgi:hypothetical protein
MALLVEAIVHGAVEQVRPRRRDLDDPGCWRRPKTEPLLRVVPIEN